MSRAMLLIRCSKQVNSPKEAILTCFFLNVATKGEGHFSDKRCSLSLHNQRRLASAEH